MTSSTNTESIINSSDIQSYGNLKKSLTDYVYTKSNEDFLTFVRKEAPKIVPEFKMGRHIQVLCHKLQQVVDGKCNRLWSSYHRDQVNQ